MAILSKPSLISLLCPLWFILQFATHDSLAADHHDVTCEGTYAHHLQGICTDQEAIYWCFTTTLVKTDLDGKRLLQIPVANHHGDLCTYQDMLFVAVNLGKFNDPQGNADSWIYVYRSIDLSFVTKYAIPELVYGAGGIGVRADHFYVVGGLPDTIDHNTIYEYDSQFHFQRKHVLNSGHTHLGIQTATFAHDRWWFGCYGSPSILLIANDQFQLQGRYEFDCSLGIAGVPSGKLLSALGRCEPSKGCTGSVKLSSPSASKGLQYLLKSGDLPHDK